MRIACVKYLALMLLLASGAGLAGCAGDPNSFVIDIGKSSPERLLRFYFGSYVSAVGGDPFDAGLLEEENGRYVLDKTKLPTEVQGQLVDGNGDGTLEWDELEPFLQATYYTVRPVAGTLDALEASLPYLADTSKTFVVDIDGVMTTARRRVRVEREIIKKALESFEANGQQILYPQGTVFIGEHWEGNQRVETTVMKKRGDDFWDYFVYDKEGELAPQTTTEPRALPVPTRCVGCHFGGKRFEPEASYPGPATPGPNGPRVIHVQASPNDTLLVGLLDEHEKRSDTVLGVYATIYAGELLRTETEALSETELNLLRWLKSELE